MMRNTAETVKIPKNYIYIFRFIDNSIFRKKVCDVAYIYLQLVGRREKHLKLRILNLTTQKLKFATMYFSLSSVKI